MCMLYDARIIYIFAIVLDILEYNVNVFFCKISNDEGPDPGARQYEHYSYIRDCKAAPSAALEDSAPTLVNKGFRLFKHHLFQESD